MRVTDTSDLWWKTAIVYCLNVETYLDWNDDGSGDLEGLAHRLDYLAELGVTCLWLMPFYPSPQRDDGYDVTDYYGVDPRYGHLGDFVEVVRTAKDRGLRVIVDLVVNHTSDQHPWFQAALEGRDSPYREYYRWRDEPPENEPANQLPDAESGTWFRDERSGQYYRHSFYRHQPDLNMANPVVREEIARVIGFWLQLGVDGFRVDAVPYLLDQAESDRDEYEILRILRRYIGRRSGTGMMLGEVNRSYEEQLAFFGGDDGDGLTMQFDFRTNQALFLALVRRDARPLAETLAQRPRLAPENQWANFVRNHDELNLNQLSDEEREEVFAEFAPEESMRMHGRGIRRRLPSMLGGDQRRIRMAYSLLFSLPGAPVLYYGEEIGMAENLAVPGRNAVRAPMQWTERPDGGFSHAPADRLVAPIVEGDFAPEHVNASQQRHDDDSLLHFVQLLIARYRDSPEIGWGECRILEQPHVSVFAHCIEGPTGALVAVHNLGEERHAVPLQLHDVAPGARLVDLFRDDVLELDDGAVTVDLDGYGHRWLRVLGEHDKRLA